MARTYTIMEKEVQTLTNNSTIACICVEVVDGVDTIRRRHTLSASELLQPLADVAAKVAAVADKDLDAIIAAKALPTIATTEAIKTGFPAIDAAKVATEKALL